jgi:hypothetical protein
VTYLAKIAVKRLAPATGDRRGDEGCGVNDRRGERTTLARYAALAGPLASGNPRLSLDYVPLDLVTGTTDLI